MGIYMTPEMKPRRWIEIFGTLDTNIFTYFEKILEELGISIDQAQSYFLKDYLSAISLYPNKIILQTAESVALTNSVKYKKLIAVIKAEYNPIDNYNMTETSNDIRTPDLVATSNGTSTATGSVKNNQTRTTTDNPDGYTEKSINSVNPYDNTGMRDESQNITTQTGTRETIESYSGDADTTESTSTSDTTTTQKGTETVSHTLSRKGNIGVTTSQQMLESEYSLSQKLNIFKIIEKDIAAEIFLKVW